MYVEVILPLKLSGSFTYSSNGYDIKVGQRVVVQFGPKKIYTAIVLSTHNHKPKDYKLKSVLEVLDELPVVNKIQLNFWRWMSEYYLCTIGEIMNTALPSSLKLASETKISFNSSFDGDITALNQDEKIVVDILLNKNEVFLKDIFVKLKKRNFSLIHNLVLKDVVFVREEINEKFNKKKVKSIKLLIDPNSIDKFNLTEKQVIFIQKFLNLKRTNLNKYFSISEILNYVKISRGVLKLLCKKNIFEVIELEKSRINFEQISTKPLNKLLDFQKLALEKIKRNFLNKNVCLLHGITSSGKTEVYIHLINEQINAGKQVLYLLPEIALTTQIIKRLKVFFGNRVTVAHSNLNNSERVEIWKYLRKKSERKNKIIIVLGARSALFLPYDNLGLIIVDEEHDSSFKQQQLSPRYHARDAAIYLATLHDSKVLLGSATPSIESWYNASTKKYSLVNMNQRYSYIKPPKIDFIDLRKSYLKNQMKFQFSNEMINQIDNEIKLGKQIILFHNRRGYSPMLICNECGCAPHCIYCDVTLTYHKLSRQLRCHYCGYSQDIKTNCKKCSSSNFIDKGFGTEQIEENIKIIFPTIKVQRMDYDTTRGKNSYENIISNFEKGNTKILIGTQMLSKGLDFDNVSLVGILNADSMLNFSDFRAYERAFQLMSQVAGRAGRKGKEGKVLVQTYDIDNNIFSLLKKGDFNQFASNQLKERKIFSYPPYTRLIKISVKHKDQNKVEDASSLFSNLLKASFGSRVLGPEYPYVSRVRNNYIKNILIKIEHKSSIKEAKKILLLVNQKIIVNNRYRNIKTDIDIDPL
tara:strand:+ start:15907 stop:18333 length:2427 start_codon:yes stop_codon:yes gene_type:complete